MYKLIRGSNDVVRLSDGATIPADVRNADFQQFVRWRDGWLEHRAAGMDVLHEPNTPLPADPAPAPSKEEVDAAAARANPRLAALRDIAPADVHTWIEGMSLAQLKEVVKALVLLAIANRRG